jgi:hypothetical protein
VAHWDLSPSEFWNMTPQEWWHIYEAKHGKKTQKYGSLDYDEYQELSELVQEIKEGKHG